MKVFHYVTIEGKVSMFKETTYEQGISTESKNGFRSLPGEPDEKGVYIYSYDDYLEEVRGHIIAENQVEARKLLQKHNI